MRLTAARFAATPVRLAQTTPTDAAKSVCAALEALDAPWMTPDARALLVAHVRRQLATIEAAL